MKRYKFKNELALDLFTTNGAAANRKVIDAIKASFGEAALLKNGFLVKQSLLSDDDRYIVVNDTGVRIEIAGNVSFDFNGYEINEFLIEMNTNSFHPSLNVICTTSPVLTMNDVNVGEFFRFVGAPYVVYQKVKCDAQLVWHNNGEVEYQEIKTSQLPVEIFDHKVTLTKRV